MEKYIYGPNATRMDALKAIDWMLHTACGIWGAEGAVARLQLLPLLLQLSTTDSDVSKLLIRAGVRISDEVVVSAAQAGIEGPKLWVQLQKELQLPIGLSPAMEAACTYTPDERSSVSSIHRWRYCRLVNYSSFTFPAAAAAEAFTPDYVQELLCVLLSSFCPGFEEGSVLSELLRKHAAAVAQWTPNQLLQLLHAAIAFGLKSCLGTLLRLPAVQQLPQHRGTAVQKLAEAAAEHGNLELLLPLLLRAGEQGQQQQQQEHGGQPQQQEGHGGQQQQQQLSEELVLKLLRCATRKPCKASLEWLLQQPAAAALLSSAKVAQELLLLLAGHPDDSPDCLRQLLSSLSSSAAAAAAGGGGSRQQQLPPVDVAQQVLELAVAAVAHKWTFQAINRPDSIC